MEQRTGKVPPSWHDRVTSPRAGGTCQRSVRSEAEAWSAAPIRCPPMEPQTHRLAGTDRTISNLGLGTWAWGDRSTWGMGGYDAALNEGTIRDAWEASIDAGVTFVDTAEVYGAGESERIIGRLLAEDPERAASVVLATKFLPLPWKVAVQRSLLRSLRASLDRLDVPAVDLYQLHGPISLRSHAALAEALAVAHQAGLVRAVGVSNYSEREMRSMAAELRSRGLRLATNQIEFSLLRRTPERAGLLAACAELEVVPLAYSPLGQGRLTGKYTVENPPPGNRKFSAHPMEAVTPVVDALRRVGEVHGGRSPGQVALAWTMAKGTVPIPGAKNRDQATENAGALAFHLTAAEVAELDQSALAGTRSLGNRFWQHG